MYFHEFGQEGEVVGNSSVVHEVRNWELGGKVNEFGDVGMKVRSWFLSVLCDFLSSCYRQKKVPKNRDFTYFIVRNV